MPANSTPCYDEDCRYYREIYSPMPGESWNRCSHIKKRFKSTYKKRNIIYGYAGELCEYYEKSQMKKSTRRFISFLSFIKYIICGG